MPWTQRGAIDGLREVVAAVDELDEHLQVGLDLAPPAGRRAGDDLPSARSTT